MNLITMNCKSFAKIFLCLLFTVFTLSPNAHAQNVGIADAPFTPDPNSILEVQSNSKGILISRMTDAERVAIAPTVGDNFGLLVYQTNTISNDNAAGYWYWDGYNWKNISNGNNWSIDGNAGTNPNINFIGTADANDFVFKTNNTERARIHSSGNFGIGTVSPTSLLQVEGYGGAGPLIRVHSISDEPSSISLTTNYRAYRIGQNRPPDNPAYADGFYIYDQTANATRLYITASGYTGIGTVNPSSKFQVLNDLLSSGVNITNSSASNATDALQVVHYGTGNGIYNYSQGVTAAGYVGIQGGVWPSLGWFSMGSVAANINSGIGVYTGGRNVGVLGCAMEDGNAATDQLGGVFYTQNSAGNSWQAATCIGAVVDNLVYKVFGWGIVSTVVLDTESKPVVMAAPEAPEALFQDYGTGKLLNGKAHIYLDPILSKNITVDENHPIKVFIQLNDNCNGVFVSNKKGDGFDVEELNNGTSNANFSWMIVATRKNETRGGMTSDYESFRFKRTNNAAFNGVAANH